MEFHGINEHSPNHSPLPPSPMPDFENDKWSYEKYNIFVDSMIQYDLIKSQESFDNKVTMLPLKSMEQIEKQYESMMQPLEMSEDLYSMPTNVNNEGLIMQECYQGVNNVEGSKSNRGKIKKQRMKVVRWTEEEHRLFLMGLNRYKKGEWKKISRDYVVTKTPSQVSSHAQKFYRRWSITVPVNKRRHSIHDIQTVNSQLIPQNPNTTNISRNTLQHDSYYHRIQSNRYSPSYTDFPNKYPMLNSMNAAQGDYESSQLNSMLVPSTVAKGVYNYRMLSSMQVPSVAPGMYDYPVQNSMQVSSVAQGMYGYPVLNSMQVSGAAQANYDYRVLNEIQVSTVGQVSYDYPELNSTEVSSVARDSNNCPVLENL